MSALLTRDQVRRWLERPDVFVREMFHVEPDAWQADVLRDFPFNPMQVMLACKGPGKTTVLAWLCWYFLATRLHPKIGAVSITGKNLQDNLWPEMAKWRRESKLLEDAFEWKNERIFLKESPETWFMTAKTWPQSANETELGNTLAGMWADNVMFVLDEAGGIPVAVMRTAEVVVAKAGQDGTDGHVLMAGNTTSRDGCLFEAAVTRRHMWKVYEITADPDDPKRTPRIPAEFARKQIAEFGRDNPWVMINILAQFPKQGLNSLLSPEDVIAAQKRHYAESVFAGFPKIMGVDVAGFGDDESVICRRQGPVALPFWRMRGLSPDQGAGHVATKSVEWGADSIQVDATGGWGMGWLSHLHSMGFTNALGVQFAGKARQEGKFFNKRAEMWWDMAEWVKREGALPPVPELVAGLSSATYSFKGDRLLIEDKGQMKARLGRSVDLEDALACTFAHPVAPKAKLSLLDSISALHHRGLPDDNPTAAGGQTHNRGLGSDPW